MFDDFNNNGIILLHRFLNDLVPGTVFSKLFCTAALPCGPILPHKDVEAPPLKQSEGFDRYKLLVCISLLTSVSVKKRKSEQNNWFYAVTLLAVFLF